MAIITPVPITPADILVVARSSVPAAVDVLNYYMAQRNVPAQNKLLLSGALDTSARLTTWADVKTFLDTMINHPVAGGLKVILFIGTCPAIDFPYLPGIGDLTNSVICKNLFKISDYIAANPNISTVGIVANPDPTQAQANANLQNLPISPKPTLPAFMVEVNPQKYLHPYTTPLDVVSVFNMPVSTNYDETFAKGIIDRSIAAEQLNRTSIPKLYSQTYRQAWVTTLAVHLPPKFNIPNIVDRNGRQTENLFIDNYPYYLDDRLAQYYRGNPPSIFPDEGPGAIEAPGNDGFVPTSGVFMRAVLDDSYYGPHRPAEVAADYSYALGAIAVFHTSTPAAPLFPIGVCWTTPLAAGDIQTGSNIVAGWDSSEDAEWNNYYSAGNSPVMQVKIKNELGNYVATFGVRGPSTAAKIDLTTTNIVLKADGTTTSFSLVWQGLSMRQIWDALAAYCYANGWQLKTSTYTCENRVLSAIRSGAVFSSACVTEPSEAGAVYSNLYISAIYSGFNAAEICLYQDSATAVGYGVYTIGDPLYVPLNGLRTRALSLFSDTFDNNYTPPILIPEQNYKSPVYSNENTINYSGVKPAYGLKS